MPSLRPLAWLLLLAVGGCNIIGALAAKAPKPDIDAAYKKLADQPIGIMIWADKSILMDWPNLQLDAGNSIANKLLIAQQTGTKDVKGMTLPYPPASFVKYQKEHPEIEAMPITDVAGKLGVKRLIYVEIGDLSTRADGSSTLFLGRVEATLKIIEVDAKGVGTVGYSDVLKSQFPEKAPAEGVLNSNDRFIYAGSIDAITTAVVKRLIQHPDDNEND